MAVENQATPNQPNLILARIVVALAVCVLLSAVVVAYLWLRPAGGAQSSLQIVYVAVGTDGNLDLFQADAAGRRITQLTKSHDDELFPAWSPDGKSLAYVRLPLRFYRGTASTPDAGVFLLTFEGGKSSEQPLLPASAWGSGQPSWSPDGRRIAFVNPVMPGREGGAITGTLSLVTVSTRAVETFPITISVGLVDTSVSWSPDGSAVAFIAPRGVITSAPGRTDVPENLPSAAWIYNLSDRALSMVAEEASLVQWSPAGDWLAYANTENANGIHLVHPDGTGDRALLDRGYATDLAWSPDGSRLAACGWMEGEDQVGVAFFSLADGNVAAYPLGAENQIPQFLAWSPDGAYVAVSLFTESGGMVPDGSLWIVDAATGAAFAFPDNPGMEALAVWKPGK